MKRLDSAFERSRGIKGNRKTFMAYCPHGKMTVKNYVPYEYCDICNGHKERAFFVPNTDEHFNIGLGCMTSGTRDAEKKARKRGLRAIGDADFKSVAKSVWPNHPLTRSL